MKKNLLLAYILISSLPMHSHEQLRTEDHKSIKAVSLKGGKFKKRKEWDV